MSKQKDTSHNVPALHETHNTALAVPIDQMVLDASLDTGTVRIENLAKPFLRIIQKNVIDQHPDAKVGDILNTVSKEIYPGTEGILFVPIYFKQDFVEWKLQEAGGGFVATFGYDEGKALLAKCIRNAQNRAILPGNGDTELADTRTHFGLQIHSDGSMTGAMISMTRTQIKKSEMWLDMINRQVSIDGKLMRLPSFANVYRVSTKQDPAKDKFTWQGWHIKKERSATHMEYTAALEARSAISEMIRSHAIDYSNAPTAEADSV